MHYNEENSYLFVNRTEIHKFKAKDSEIVATPLCVGNISKDFSVDDMKKTGLNGYVYNFRVDYDAIVINDILDIHKYVIKKSAFFSNDINVLNVNSLECVSINNQVCKTRTKIIDVNSNEPVFYPFSIKVYKCSGGCNNINDPYAKLCVADIIKNINVKVFNLMSKINETRHMIWHETCK